MENFFNDIEKVIPKSLFEIQEEKEKELEKIRIQNLLNEIDFDEEIEKEELMRIENEARLETIRIKKESNATAEKIRREEEEIRYKKEELERQVELELQTMKEFEKAIKEEKEILISYKMEEGKNLQILNEEKQRLLNLKNCEDEEELNERERIRLTRLLLKNDLVNNNTSMNQPKKTISLNSLLKEKKDLSYNLGNNLEEEEYNSSSLLQRQLSIPYRDKEMIFSFLDQEKEKISTVLYDNQPILDNNSNNNNNNNNQTRNNKQDNQYQEKEMSSRISYEHQHNDNIYSNNSVNNKYNNKNNNHNDSSSNIDDSDNSNNNFQHQSQFQEKELISTVSYENQSNIDQYQQKQHYSLPFTEKELTSSVTMYSENQNLSEIFGKEEEEIIVKENITKKASSLLEYYNSTSPVSTDNSSMKKSSKSLSNHNISSATLGNNDITLIKLQQTKSDESINILKLKLEAIEMDNVTLVEELDRVVKEKEENIIMNIRNEEEIKKLKKDLFELNNEKNGLTIKLGSMSIKEVDLDLYKNDTEGLRVINAELEKNLYKSASDLNTLRSELQFSKTDLNKVRVDLARLKSEQEIVISDNMLLRDEVERLKHDVEFRNSSLDLRLKDSELEKRKLEEQVKILHAEVIDRVQISSRTSEELLTFDRRVSQLDAENASLRRRLHDADTIERDFSQARRLNSSLESELRDLATENMRLRTSAGIYSSSSHIHNNNNNNNNQDRDYRNNKLNNHLDHTALNEKKSYNNMPTSELQYDSKPPLSNYSVSSSNSSNYNHSTHNIAAVEPNNYQSSLSTNENRRYSTSNNSSDNNHSSMPRSLASMMNSTSTSSNIEQSKPSSWSNQPTETTKPPPPPSQQQRNVSNDNIQSSSISFTSSPKTNRSPTRSPFATDQTAAYQGSFDDLEKKLTSYMSEKTSLLEESERLHSRGGKLLKERTRLNQVESRLSELSKDISTVRKQLLVKPS